MSEPSDDRRVVSIATLVMAMRRESVADAAICRVLAEALGVDDATAHAYAEGRPPAPVVDPGELHALLTDAQERGDWPAVVALIGRIAELEPDLKRRAQYLFTEALVQRIDLKDREAALESLDQTLDCDPSMLRAFETQCAMLGEHQDWKRLERAHRKMIRRVRGDAALEFTLFQALAVIYRDRLDHESAAIEAFKMALALRPDDEGILAALQELGETRAVDARRPSQPGSAAGIVAPMEYDGDPAFNGVDGQWIVDGPNSGGVKFFVLWRGHLFLVEQEFSSGSIGRGIPAAEFAAAHRDSDDVRYRWIVEDLDARGLTS